jgi:hypothetical protein
MKFQIITPTTKQTVEANDIYMAIKKARVMSYAMGCDLTVKSTLSGATYKVKCPKVSPVTGR